MAQITDPEAIRFVNEVIRPLYEAARDLKMKIDAAKAQWDGGISTKFTVDLDTVEDGREAEGVSRLTAKNVKDAGAQIFKVGTGQASEWTNSIIAKCCVRLLP